MKYQSLREALDDFPEFEWDDLFEQTMIIDKEAFEQWRKDYADLMQAIQDGTVKHDN